MKVNLKKKGKYIVDQFRHFSKVTGYPVKVHLGISEEEEEEKKQKSELIKKIIEEYGGTLACTTTITIEIDGIGRYDMLRKKHLKRLNSLCEKLESKYENLSIMVENTAEEYSEDFEDMEDQSLTPDQQVFYDATTHNRESIERSKMCGCYYCEYIFPASEITDDNYTDQGSTACCPHCDMDTVYGDASGVELTPKHLKKLHCKWFGDDR